jgi:hypothetical protein
LKVAVLVLDDIVHGDEVLLTDGEAEWPFYIGIVRLLGGSV